MKRFRQATDDDSDAILEMMRRYYEEEGYPFVKDVARTTLKTLNSDDRLGKLWVADMEGKVAGYVAVTLGFSLEFGGMDAFLDEIYIDEPFRGQGLGKAAAELAVGYCRGIGVKALHLEVEPHRTAARRLYERMGFENHDRELMTRKI
jgi:ribosomal protein S18 acetylase RimI-like enzyme